MPSRDEVEDLKASWRRRPSWNLADSAGFEEHRAELLEYMQEVRAEFGISEEQPDAVSGWLKEIAVQLMDLNRNMHEMITHVRDASGNLREIKDALRRSRW